MAEKNMKARIQHKHGLASEWALAVNFSPKEGELIIYDPDESYPYPRVKVGDGATNVNDLPFVYAPLTIEEIDEVCGSVMITGEEAQL